MSGSHVKIATRRWKTLAAGLGILATVTATPIAAKGAAKPDLTPRAGAWRLEGASEGATSCLLRLSAEETIGGRGAKATGRCPAAYPWTGNIMAWRSDPAKGAPPTIVLADAERHTLARFVLADTGEVYTAAVGGEDFALYPPLPTPKTGKRKEHKA